MKHLCLETNECVRRMEGLEETENKGEEPHKVRNSRMASKPVG